MSHLAVQTVLVSGAIGQAICTALVSEGARAVIHYSRNEAAARRLVDRLGGQGLCLAAAQSGIPFGRIGRPDEVAGLVAFLANGEAASMCGSLVEITGAQAVS